jgi:hypothetical protein
MRSAAGAADVGDQGEHAMGTTLTATFETRREAEMTIERLVQEHGIDRTDIFVAAEGDENTAGVEKAGSDDTAGQPSPEARGDAPLNGAVTVSVDLEDEAMAAKVRDAFGEFDAAEVDEA